MIAPVWKPIGEASASFDANGLWIEKIDGFRVAVRRYFLMPLDADMREAMRAPSLNPFMGFNW